ncbi:unnamed protein product [Paramecium primaurelia]|uniref:Transmembrane protein n=1 Tax=Paramecium primaurelia TaxID=5886 RepID=A0A8S1KB58_PARPR|nr:unnamed protein product [Paramecium primaurelia]
MTDINLRDNFLKQHKFISMFICYPIKTLIRFQQKHGTLLQDSLKLIYKEGGFRRFYSGFFYRYISKSAEFVVLLEALNSWSNITKNNVNPINLLLSFMMGITIQYTFLPFNSLYYFQQVYGHSDGKELLFYKVKQNGASVFYHGFWSFLLGSLSGSLGAFPALQNYQTYNNQEENKKSEYCLFYLYSTFLTAEVISNPFKILAIQRLTSIECKSYAQIYNQLMKEQGYQWIFRSIDTKLLYSFLKTSFIVYAYDYKKLSREM